MTLIPPTDHKWAALHGAVWSGGSFVYVPAGVQVEIPLQSYFRLNAPGAGQFEHTMIIVEEGLNCTSSKVVLLLNMTYLTFMQALLNCSLKIMLHCVILQLKTGPKTCTTLTQNVVW